jgi:arylsulfatase A
MKLGALCLGLLVCTVGLAPAQTTPTPSKPNIVLILIDDMGYGDIEPFGSTISKTPNLNRMAKEGMKLTSFYNAAVCSCSRAQVMTGCYGQRVSIVNALPPASKTALNLSERTVANYLHHLGDQTEYLPTHRGFDHYFGLPYSNDMLDTSKALGVPVVPLIRDDQVVELITKPNETTLTDRYTDEALKFIDNNKSHPFFLYFAHTAVHAPISPGVEWQGKSGNGRFSDWVEQVDWSVGQVMTKLHDLKLDSNTLVMFTSDNGPWLLLGKDAGSAGPLRGGKFTTWEGGEREPTLARWPGHIAPGTVSDVVTKNCDFLPTFVSLAGGTVPASPKIDGQDISPLLLGKVTAMPDNTFYYFTDWRLEAVRQGQYKLALRPQRESARFEWGSHLSPDANTSDPRLYDLNADIGEKTNVAAAHPDVVAKLTTLFNTMAGDICVDGKPGPGARPPGRIDNAQIIFPTIPNKKK